MVERTKSDEASTHAYLRKGQRQNKDSYEKVKKLAS